jgi:hypothetical protein
MVTKSKGTFGETEAAQSISADNLKLESIQSPANVKRALDIARRLARWGVPIFLARPARDSFGQWDPGGGHRKTGYWFPKKWQLTKPDPKVVNRWKPGWALCAVMGKVVDLLDTDPRNGGNVTRQTLVEAGCWPTIYWQAATQSDGLHDFVATMGVRSKDDVRPGLDVKAGKDGAGHGFAFIAPTVKAAKPSGELKAYRWIVEPTTVPPKAGDDTARAIVELVALSRGDKQPSGKPATGSATKTSDRRDELNALPKEEPCDRMRAQWDLVAQTLTRSHWHKTGLGPVIQLVRLAREGHRGLRQALEALSEDFVTRATSARAGGAVEAQHEWDTSVDGALAKVLGTHGRFPVHPACDCLLVRLRRAAQDPALFSRGIAGVTERRVITYLLEAARLKHSLLVRESQRQIAEAIDRRAATVNTVLSRLEGLGWIRRLAGVDLCAPAPILVLLPNLQKDSSNIEAAVPPPLLLAGPLVVTPAHSPVHRLFGPAGLGGGAEETFAALPEYRVKLRRRSLVRILPGAPATPGLLNPWQGTRPISRPATSGAPTIQDLSEASGKHPSTIRRQLKKMLEWRLVFEETRPGQPSRWWRLRFDPEWVADGHQIPHTSDIKAFTHARERRPHLDALIRAAGGPASSRLVAQDIDGQRLYIDTATGAVRGSVPMEAWEEDQ